MDGPEVSMQEGLPGRCLVRRCLGGWLGMCLKLWRFTQVKASICLSGGWRR